MNILWSPCIWRCGFSGVGTVCRIISSSQRSFLCPGLQCKLSIACTEQKPGIQMNCRRGTSFFYFLGCMAERLKGEILNREKMVDLLAGPDAYRDLPRLLAVVESGQQAANVLLSLDETYADIMPVQTSPSATSAFVWVILWYLGMNFFLLFYFWNSMFSLTIRNGRFLIVMSLKVMVQHAENNTWYSKSPSHPSSLFSQTISRRFPCQSFLFNPSRTIPCICSHMLIWILFLLSFYFIFYFF